jgi:nitrate reductase gamma subunit
MESVAFLFYFVTPYVAAAAFLGGIAYRLSVWRQRSPVPVHLSMFPRPESPLARLGHALVDTFTLKGLWKVNRPLWVGAFAMHLGLLSLLLGHVRTVTDYYLLWELLNWGEEQQALFSHLAGIVAGVLFMVPLVYLLGRRFAGAVKWISVPEDYLILLLLLGIAITGNHMRFLVEVDVHQLRAFLQGLIFFRWAPAPASAGISFIYHFAMVQLLMIYFPFSKLSHTIGTVLSKMVARS